MTGRQIAHYRVGARLGQGGMGEVYLADDLSLRRKVALKFVSPGAATDADAARRLQQEAYAVAALDHPFICKVFEAGDAGGQRYIAMEFVEGQTLKDRLSAGPLGGAEVARLAGEIAEALEYAHARGIVHRDLKPANVMLSTDGHVKVMDFGIARRLPTPDMATYSRAATEGDHLTGTLAYMSPEQVRGVPVDARSDVFSFGVLLYELLSGTHPFLRDSAFATAEAIVREPAAPLESRVRDLPAGLDTVVAGCLEKDRDRRLASFKDVRAALARPDEVEARRLAPPQTRKRRRRLVAAGAVAAAILVLAWWRPSWLPFSGPALAFAERDWMVIADVENLTGDPVFDRSLGAALDVGIAQSQYVNVFSRDRLLTALQRMRRPRDAPVDETLAIEVAVREGLRAVLVCSIAQVGDVYAITARVIDPQTSGTVVRNSVQANGRDRVLDALNDLAARVRRRLGESLPALSAQGLPLPLATTGSLEALKLYADSLRLGPQEDATGEELLRQAIDIDPDFAIALAALGYRYFLRSSRVSRTEGDQLFARALALTNRLTTRERLWIPAMADDARGNREQAVTGYKAYLAQYPDDSRAWFRLGWTQMATLGQLDAGVEAFTRVTTIDPKHVGGWINLATCYAGLRQHERAVETYQKAFALSPDEILGQFVNNEYGSVLVRLGRMDEARQTFEKMTMAPDAQRQARGHRSIAFLEMHLGRYASATAALDRAIQLNEANGYLLSAFRDRFIKAQARLAVGARADVIRELALIDGLIAKLSLGPEWLSRVVKMRVRLGQIADAQRVVTLIARTVGNTLTDTAVSRNLGDDQGHLDLARGEIELALGRPDEAVRLVAAAAARLSPQVVLESAARALRATGKTDDAVARYEELLRLAPIGLEEQEDAVEAHAALGALYERLGRVDQARALYEKLIAQWKDADADVVVLREVRARLKALSKS